MPDKARIAMSQRLGELAEHFGSAAKLAKKAGINYTTIKGAIDTHGGLAATNAALIIEKTGCSAQWFLRGAGEMFGPAQPGVSIPTYRIGAGHHLVASEHLQPYSTKIPSALLGYRVDGDSMEPVARHGQVVLALRGEDAKTGDLAAVEMKDGEVTFKRVHFQDGHVILQPVNPSHPVVMMKRSEIRNAWKVWGVKF